MPYLQIPLIFLSLYQTLKNKSLGVLEPFWLKGFRMFKYVSPNERRVKRVSNLAKKLRTVQLLVLFVGEQATQAEVFSRCRYIED